LRVKRGYRLIEILLIYFYCALDGSKLPGREVITDPNQYIAQLHWYLAKRQHPVTVAESAPAPDLDQDCLLSATAERSPAIAPCAAANLASRVCASET
jgi:hypothetical protein